jgi:hypothetical protein
MEITTIDILKVSNEFYCVIKNGTVITPPTKVEKGSITVLGITEDIEVKIANTIEELNDELYALGFTVKDSYDIIQQFAPWHIEQCTIRVYMDSMKYNKMIREVNGLFEYFKSVGIPFVEYDNGGFLYLTEIYPEHEQLLNQYGAKIEYK